MTGVHYRLGVVAGALVLSAGTVTRSHAYQPIEDRANQPLAALVGSRIAACPMTGTLADGKAVAGEAIYAKKCAKCHGATGDGKGRGSKALEHKPKPWTTTDEWNKTTDKVKFEATKCGGKAAGKTDDMPDYPELTDQQIWDVLAYAKTFSAK